MYLYTFQLSAHTARHQVVETLVQARIPIPKAYDLGCSLIELDIAGPSGSHTHIKLRTPKLNLHIPNGGRTSRFHHLRYTISSIYVSIFIYTDKYSPTIQRNNTPAKITSNIYIPIYDINLVGEFCFCSLSQPGESCVSHTPNQQPVNS